MSRESRRLVDGNILYRLVKKILSLPLEAPGPAPREFDCAVSRGEAIVFGCKIDSCWNGNED
jgi:hypothetical protein